MSKEITAAKKSLRSQIFQARAEMSFDSRIAADEKITETVLQHPAYKSAKQVFCYVSMPHEVSTRALLAAILKDGKTLGLPVCEPESWISAHIWRSWMAKIGCCCPMRIL